MAVTHSDREIEGLVKERKPLSEGYLQLIRFKSKLGHKECDLSVKGDNGNDFQLIVRQSNSNPLDFSVILAHRSENTNKLFRLRRYNGKSHEHTNTIERERFYDFHIHKATERYQGIGASEDKYAEPTSRFFDLHSALQYILDDCGFDVPEGPQTSSL